ncbi:MAG: cobalamin-dependent protein [Promethearchaeia archaeon]
MKILLVNPNRFKIPPVIPIGLEYLSSAVEKRGYDVDLLDLCFSDAPENTLKGILRRNNYDMIGFSIRNIDSAVYFNHQFFLKNIRKLVQIAKKTGIQVILGGSGFSAMPNKIFKYMGADYGIIGPAEKAMVHFLEKWEKEGIDEPILDGTQYGIDKNATYMRARKIDYEPYLEKEGIVGFGTHIGCAHQCPYCVEGGTREWFREISSVIQEIKYLVNQGYKHFHLCDSEFNADLNYAINFCNALAKENMNITWTLYMKPYPYTEQLFRALRDSGANLITLSVDSDNRIQKQNRYTLDDVKMILDYGNKYGIDIAIDLLTGYPGEPVNSTKKIIKFFKNNRPKTVGVSFIYRIYENTPLGDLIQNSPSLKHGIIKSYSGDLNLLKPTFYVQLKREFLENLFKDDDLFQLAGLKEGVNYQF